MQPTHTLDLISADPSDNRILECADAGKVDYIVSGDNHLSQMDPLDLSLTHGQVAWALARGQPPSEQLIDELRYLRQLGVPFSKTELGPGSGNRIRYGFDHLIELGVAVFGLERGMRPREIARILVDHRAELRRCYRDTLAALPESAFTAEWVKSRGAMVPFIKERFLRLHG